jgi:PAS domain S-box-containing protein
MTVGLLSWRPRGEGLDVSAKPAHRVANAVSLIAILLGCAGFLGWVFDIAALKSVLPAYNTMKMNTAICFVLAGTSLLVQMDRASALRRAIARVCALLVVAVGALTLLEYAIAIDVGIDQLLIRSPAGELQTSSPGRMASNTALSFALSGMALLFLDAKKGPLRFMSQVLAMAVLLVGYVAATGYVLGVTAFYGIPGYGTMAIHTAIGFVALSVGILAERPHVGVAAIVAQKNHAGAAIRWLLPLIVVFPLAVAWVRLKGQQAGFYGTEFGLSLMVTVDTSIFASLALWNAHVQGVAERARERDLGDSRFLSELSDMLRTSSKSTDALFDVSEKLGEYLGVSRCLFIEVDVANDRAKAHRDYCHGLPPLAGFPTLSSFSPKSLVDARAGRTLVSGDTSSDEQTAQQYENTYRPAGIRARVMVPLLRSGQFVSTLLVSTHEPRIWQAREVALIQLVAERTWLWFEHLVALEGLRRREEERNRAEAGMRESEERFRLFVDAVKDHAIFLLNPDGTVATWNAGAERLHGYRADEIVGQHISKLFTPQDIEAKLPQKELDSAAREGTCEQEAWRVRKDGSRVWTNVVVSALRGAQGELVGFGKVTRDMTERLRANEQFRLAIEAAPTGMLMTDRAGKIVLVNVQIEKLFGYARDELLGQRIEMLIPERLRHRHPEHRAVFFEKSAARLMGAGRHLHGLRKDGTEVPIEIGLNPLKTSEGDFALISVADITERRRSEQEREDLMGQLRTLNTDLEKRVTIRTSQLTASLKERETLLQEIHHRVKNNLQVISSLINMQARKMADAPSRNALEECRTRVQAIALIHEKLYQSRDYSKVPFSEYARSLAGNIFHATGVSPGTVALEFDIETLSLAVDKAIPCGLIMNELITNALKHAFPNERPGVVRLTLRQVSDGKTLLAVADDGIGLPASFDLQTSTTLGMQLVTTLVKQLDGRLEIDRTGGAKFSFTFSAEASQ